SLGMHAVPGVDGQTDAQGSFRLNPFLGNRFTLIVSAPPGQAYLGVKKTLCWPQGAAKQTVNLALTPGVFIRGTVIDAGTDKPVSKARVDFWSKNITQPKDAFDLPPEGILYPGMRKTDAQGAFEVIVPPGRCHLFVNGPSPDYVLKKIAAKEVLVQEPDVLEWQLGGVWPWTKRFYYPDEWTALNFKVGDKPKALKLVLRKAPVVQVRVVGPDGKLAKQAQIFQAQAPFAELAHGFFGEKYEVSAGQFKLPLRNLEA